MDPFRPHGIMRLTADLTTIPTPRRLMERTVSHTSAERSHVVFMEGSDGTSGERGGVGRGEGWGGKGKARLSSGIQFCACNKEQLCRKGQERNEVEIRLKSG